MPLCSPSRRSAAVFAKSFKRNVRPLSDAADSKGTWLEGELQCGTWAIRLPLDENKYFGGEPWRGTLEIRRLLYEGEGRSLRESLSAARWKFVGSSMKEKAVA